MSDRLALDGGAPVRPTMLTYSRQSVDESDGFCYGSNSNLQWLGVDELKDLMEDFG